MKTLELVEKFEIGTEKSFTETKRVREIYNGSKRRMLEVELSENAVLTRHKTPEPISVLCLSGRGVFSAGADLEEKLELSPGVLLTLEAGVEHEVAAAPEILLLVTKFKDI